MAAHTHRRDRKSAGVYPRFAARPDLACGLDDFPAFFPEDHGLNAGKAIYVCERCPVRQECLDWALTHDEQFGIWGGKTPRARRAMLKKRTPPTAS